MRNKMLFSFAVFLFLIGLAGVTPAEPQGEECGGPGVTISKPNGWAGDNVLRGRGTVRDLKNVLLWAADASYNMQCGEDRLKTFILREITLSLDTTVPLQNVFLVVDKNGNFKADADEERFPVTVSANALEAKNLNIRLPYNKAQTILVVADLSEVRDKDAINLKLDYTKSAKVEPVEMKPTYGGDVFMIFTERVSHWRGNRSPELFFSSESPFSNKYSVFPWAGSPQEEYEFTVQYRDDDGDKPARAEVWIDVNGNGEVEVNERFPMVDQKPETTFRNLHPFSFKKAFTGSGQKGLKFRFYFADADSPAVKGKTGTPTALEPATVFELQFNQNILVQVGGTRKGGYLPGEIIPVKIGVLVYWQGAYEIDWSDFGKKANPKFFAFKGLSVGERRYFNEAYDIEEAILFFEAPGTRAEKNYAIDLPPLSFTAKVDGRKGKIGVPRFEIPVTLKSRVEGPFVDQTAVRVGEPITYRVRSLRLASAARPQELEHLTFKPFVEVKREIKSVRTRDLVIEDFVFTLMLFEAKGEYGIPAFKFPFGELPGFAVTLLPSKGAGKIAMPYNEQTLRTVPAPFLPKAGQALLGVSLLAFLFIVRRPMWAGLLALSRFRWSRTWQDRVTDAHKCLRVSVQGAKSNPSRDALLAVYHGLREYFGVIADPTGVGKLSGVDARTFRNTLRGSVDLSLLDTFVELEDALTSSQDLRASAETLAAKLDQTTLAMYAQLN